MSGPRTEGSRPIADELSCLQQAVSILKLVEELGRAGDFEDDNAYIADVIASARRLVEEAIEAFTACFASQERST